MITKLRNYIYIVIYLNTLNRKLYFINRSIVKDNPRFLLYFKREPVKKIHNSVCIDGFLCCQAFILIPSIFCAEYKIF